MTGDYLFFDNLAKEIDAILLGGKINRVSEPEANEIVLGVYAKGVVYNLHLCAKPDCPHIRLSDDKIANPESCPSFCMFLRKHLVGGEITAVETINNDRIIRISIEARDDMHYSVRYSLLLEIMSRNSNIIVTDSEGIIREALKKGDLSRGSERVMLSGMPYEMPQNKRIFCGDIESIYNAISNMKTVNEMLKFFSSSVAGIGKAGILFLTEQVTCSLVDNADCKINESPQISSTFFDLDICEQDRQKTVEIVMLALDKLLNPKKYGIYCPCVLLKSNVPSGNIIKLATDDCIDADLRFNDMHLIANLNTIQDADEINGQKNTFIQQSARNNSLDENGQKCVDDKTINKNILTVPFDNMQIIKENIFDCYHIKVGNHIYETNGSLNLALNLYTHGKINTVTVDRLKNTLLKTVKKLEQKLKSKAEYCEKAIREAEKADYYRKLGEIIINNIYLIKSTSQTLELMDYEEGRNISVPFDNRLTASQNAKRYFNKYSKLKRAKDINETRLLEILEEIDRVTPILYELNEAKEPEILEDIKTELIAIGLLPAPKTKRTKGKQKKTYDISQIKAYSIEGFNLLVGRNNIQNNEITFEMAKAHDMWLHVKGYHGSHCILITEGKAVPDSVLVASAQIAAHYSEAKSSPKCEVDYTDKCNVKRHQSKALGLVNYVNYKTVTTVPNEHTEFLKKLL